MGAFSARPAVPVVCALVCVAFLGAAPLEAQTSRPAIPPSRTARPPATPPPAADAPPATASPAAAADDSASAGSDPAAGAVAPSGSGVEPFRLRRPSMEDDAADAPAVQAAAPAARPADPSPPSAAPSRSLPAPPSSALGPASTVIILRGGTIEAVARLVGRSSTDVVGEAGSLVSDGRPDTEIELKLDASGFVLEWMEVRSAPDPTELLWTTRGGRGSRALGLVQGGRLLNDTRGGVAGLAIDDFVLLSLYVEDGGLLERLYPPGTIVIGFQGGDVATIPIAP